MQLRGTNIFIEDLAIKCVFEIKGWSTVAQQVTMTYFKRTERFGNRTESLIDCAVPLISSGRVKPEVRLYLMYEDLQHTTNQIVLQTVLESQISKISPLEIELGKPNIIDIAGTGFLLSHSYLCIITNPTTGVKGYEQARFVNSTHLACTASPIYDQEGLVVSLSVFTMSTNKLLS